VNAPTPEARLGVRQRPIDRAAIMFQKWRNLLFLHWEYPVETIQRTLPEGLFVDTFDGKAYLGIVPFFMKDVRPPVVPALPGLSNFQEMNFRTYVHDRNGIPGIWFYSLDAGQWLAVKVVRALFHLPYYYAAMTAWTEADGRICYRARREADPQREMSYDYRSRGQSVASEPGSLEFFLIERYVLFSWAASSRTLYSLRVWHVPYPLESVEVTRWDAELFTLDGFSPPSRKPDHLVFSPGVDVEIFMLSTVR
jgi:uncharacterized protein YqjF (DUF2071 family)